MNDPKVKLDAAAYTEALSRGNDRLRGPRAICAHFDATRNRVIICLSTGVEIAFSPQHAQGLESAAAKDLGEIEITPSGLGVSFPKIDADFYIPALLDGLLGSQKWTAEIMGRSGGAARSAKKSAAARENGRRGGRPRKTAA